MTEKERIQKILAGDLSAFAHFVDSYQDMAVCLAFRICENRQDAEDIVQNAFVKAYHNLHTFRADSKFSSWLYRIVYNLSMTHVTTMRHKVEYTSYENMDAQNSFSEWDTMGQMIETERNKVLHEQLSKLPKDEGVLLTLFYMDDTPIKEIALILGYTEANVKVKLHRARKHLADNLSSIMSREAIIN